MGAQSAHGLAASIAVHDRRRRDPVRLGRGRRSPTPQGQARVRRLVDLAWSGGALPIVVVSPDPDGGGRGGAGRLRGDATAEPAPVESGPVGQMVRGIELAAAEVRDTTAALIWPARMTWVGRRDRSPR